MVELTELEIDGDHASGKIGDGPVELVRVDGRWLAKMKKPELF